MGCGNPRAPLILATLTSQVLALGLLAHREPEADCAAWVRGERMSRLGLAVFLLDAGTVGSLGLGQVASAPLPDGERWLLPPEGWSAREQTPVGAA